LLLQLDTYLFRLINGRWTTSWLDALGIAFDRPWWLWLPLVAVAGWLLIKGDRRARLFVVVALVAVALTDIFCAQVIKPLVARVRPCVALEGARLLVAKKTSWSMPSNHAANLTAASCSIGFYARRWLWLAVPVTVLVSYSRVYVGVHYPFDALVGAVVGAAVAALTWQAGLAVERRLPARRSSPSG